MFPQRTHLTFCVDRRVTWCNLLRIKSLARDQVKMAIMETYEPIMSRIFHDFFCCCNLWFPLRLPSIHEFSTTFPLVEVRSMGARLHSHYPEIGTTLAVWRPGKKMEGWGGSDRHGPKSVPYFGDDLFLVSDLVGRFSGFFFMYFHCFFLILLLKNWCFVSGVLWSSALFTYIRTTS